MGSWDIAQQSQGQIAYDPTKTGKQKEKTHHESKFKAANQEDDYEEGGVERTR
jgi:hypothetical protein